jgi:hypothetical protein
MPQLGLQHTSPTLQVCMPQDWLSGYVISPQQRFAASQGSPGRMQRPQLVLQQSSPTLHVLGPQATLVASRG